MEVPLPRACSKRLMSFFTFHISMFFSASLAWGALIASEGEDYGRSGSRCCRAVVWCPEFPKSYPCEEFRILLVYPVVSKSPKWDFSRFYAVRLGRTSTGNIFFSLFSLFFWLHLFPSHSLLTLSQFLSTIDLQYQRLSILSCAFLYKM